MHISILTVVIRRAVSSACIWVLILLPQYPFAFPERTAINT